MSFLSLLVPCTEIVILAIIINYLLSFFWNTKAMDLAFGLIAFLALYTLSSWLKLEILHKIMYLGVNVAVIGILIIFQPELRVALSKLSWKGKRYREITELDRFLDHLATSIFRMSEKRVGALILLEREHSLSEYTSKGIILNARFSPELLESIFATTTPLHDGAVVIKNEQILSAAVILPLAEDTAQVGRTMGTRHRAALGISQLTDALAIVISEESGKVSIAREGVMTRGVKMDRLKGIVRSIFSHPVHSTGTLPSFKR